RCPPAAIHVPATVLRAARDRKWQGPTAVAQRESPAYCRGGSAMSVALRIHRSVRAGNLHNGWVRVLLCSALALVVAIGGLDGAVQGSVGMLAGLRRRVAREPLHLKTYAHVVEALEGRPATPTSTT